MPIVATCHCGATRLEVDRLPESVTACTCTYSLVPLPFLNDLLAPNAVPGVRVIPCFPRVVPGKFNIESKVLNKAIHDSLGRINSTSQHIMESCEEAVL